jgi:hypothetical protein
MKAFAAALALATIVASPVGVRRELRASSG